MAARFDYRNQAWIENGLYVRCGHPESMDCGCYGREHEGERAECEGHEPATGDRPTRQVRWPKGKQDGKGAGGMRDEQPN